MSSPAEDTVRENTLRLEHGPFGPAARGTQLCLVVHDDLELRLKLTDWVRGAGNQLACDTINFAGLDAMLIERLSSYVAILMIVQFGAREPVDPLDAVVRLHSRLPRLPVFVFGRSGDERSAARAIKLGANDYWPMHAADITEFAAALQPLLAPAVSRAPADATVSKADPNGRPEIAGYRLAKTIARSAAASVYLATCADGLQSVALKVQAIQGRTKVSDADQQRFVRECEILSRLNHRSIADVIDFGVTPDYLYLALEYFPCGSLRERMKNPVSEVEAVNYARQIAEALRVVHGAGVVHRDLKPSNLMLTTDNRVVLIDFGSARTSLVSQDSSPADPPTGTPYYVCPEQIAGEEPDERGDLYSLGVVFYEMLTGRLPFKGASLAEIFEGHSNGAVPPLPQPLHRFQPSIDRLLAKNPADRFASAADFLDALNSIHRSA